MRKLASKLIITVIALCAIWFEIPLGLTYYINKKYSPEIKIENSSIVGLTCAKLINVHINKPTISGIVNSAIVCYNGHTVNIDGGKLSVFLTDSLKSENKKFVITAKNINVHLAKGNVSADLSDVSINPKTICANKAIISHPKADTIIFNLCLDRKNNNLMASNGTITPNLYIKGHKIEDVSFTSLFKATRTEIIVGEIKYENSLVSDVHANLKDGFISINIGTISASHNRLFNVPLTIQNVSIFNISKENPLSSKITINVGDKVSVLADIEKQKFSGKNTCNNWLEIVPEELKINQILQMRLKGDFSFDIQFNPVSLKINSTCSINGPTPQFITNLNKPFKYTAYHPDGTPFERISGPGTIDWIPLDFVDNMATALTITEDPGFWHHRGIIPQALENSLKDDLRLGKFFRGGSTITMQLAKNLWLNRSRTLGRKLQEGILTIALESGLSKEKILELYLNIVEFGPNTYGIGPGCARFLKKYPGAISLSEALYMATRLPAPNRANSYEANRGFIKKLIAIGVASGKISEEELSAELQAEQIKENEELEEDLVEN